MKLISLFTLGALFISSIHASTQFSREWSCRGMRVEPNLELKVVTTNNEAKVNYRPWENNNGEWHGINLGVKLAATPTPERELSSEEFTYLMSGSLVKVHERIDGDLVESEVISIPSKSTERLRDLAQMDKSLTPEEIDEIVGKGLAVSNSRGFYEIGECTSRRNCYGVKELDPSQVYFVSPNTQKGEPYSEREQGNLEPGKFYKLLKVTLGGREGYLSRPCENIASRRTGETIWKRSIFLVPHDYNEENFELSNEQTHSELIEVNWQSRRAIVLNVIERSKSELYQRLNQRLARWDLKYVYQGEFSGVYDRYTDLFSLDSFFILHDMDLVRFPAIPEIVDGQVYYKGPFNSFHYVMNEDSTAATSINHRDYENIIVREAKRDSFLEPTAACGFLSFLELHQRSCLLEVHKSEEELSELIGQNREDYDPLNCYKSDDPAACQCTPIQWGDMFAPYGVHKTHDEKNCVDVRYQKVDGTLGPGLMGRFDIEKNKKMVQRMCDAGATRILFGHHLETLNRHLNEVARSRGLRRSRCRVVNEANHQGHFHVCFDKDQMKSSDREYLEQTCYHPDTVNYLNH